MQEAFESFAFSKQFGWTDDYTQKLKKENHYRYRMYTSMFDGFGKTENEE